MPVVALVTLISLASTCHGPSQILQSILDNGYDTAASPTVAGAMPNGGPTQVETATEIVSVVHVDAVRQAVTLALWAWTAWSDPRLTWNSSCTGKYVYEKDWRGAGHILKFQGSPVGRVWDPQIYVENALTKPVLAQENWYLSSEGRVSTARKEQWTLMCAMDYTMMPYDTQSCFMRLNSWAETADSVLLLPMDGVGIAYHPERLPGDVAWTIKEPTGNRSNTFVSDYDYMVLDFFYLLERHADPYMNAELVPIVMLVALVYLSFWISRAAVPARVAIVVVSYLALENKLGSIAKLLPKVDGAVWLIDFCTCARSFVLVATIEFAIVNYLYRAEARIGKAREALHKKVEEEQKAVVVVVDESDEQGDTADVSMGAQSSTGLRRKLAQQVGRIDRLFLSWDGRSMWLNDQRVETFFRIVYPLAYIVALLVLYARVNSDVRSGH